jgi:hypothetical protein
MTDLCDPTLKKERFPLVKKREFSTIGTGGNECNLKECPK